MSDKLSMSDQDQVVVDTTRDYYDSSDADNFYFHVWGGEDIHVGIYTRTDEPIRDASHRTVERMLDALSLEAGSRVLDIGSGYGGSARVIARRYGCHVTALNLSPVQNARAREMNQAQGLADRIDVIDGSFEDLPLADNSYDVVWCQDSILHSARRRRVFSEVDRVLRPGGSFIFTDPMQQDDVDPELLAPVLARIHLPSMGSVSKFAAYAAELGWDTVGIERMPDAIVKHYGRVLAELTARRDALAELVSADYIDRMTTGLTHWVAAGEQGALDWGILHFRKPE